MEYAQINTPNWLKTLLANKKITDIFLNGASKIFYDDGSGLKPFVLSDTEKENWTEKKLKSWVLYNLSKIGKSWDAKSPFVDATLLCGFRLHASLQQSLEKSTLVSLRKIKYSELEFQQTQEILSNWKKSPFYELLKKEIKAGSSMIISGATGSGKTTLANTLLNEISPTERIISLEDTPELHPNHPHFIQLLTRPPNSDNLGEITLSNLLKQTLRMRPDRIVLGECRGSEVLELLQLINTGHHGALSTIHANSPRDALRRIELLCLLTNKGGISSRVIKELIVSGLKWVVQVQKVTQWANRREICAVHEVSKLEQDTILLKPMLN